MRLEEYEMHIYDKTEKAFLKWREGADGAGELKKEHQVDVKTEYCIIIIIIISFILIRKRFYLSHIYKFYKI